MRKSLLAEGGAVYKVSEDDLKKVKGRDKSEF